MKGHSYQSGGHRGSEEGALWVKAREESGRGKLTKGEKEMAKVFLKSHEHLENEANF